MRKNLNKSLLLGWLMVVPMLALPSCKKNEQSTQPPPKSVAKAKPTVVAVPIQKQLTSAKADISSLFDFKNKKDPFKPFVAALPAAMAPQTRSKMATDLLPIQSYDVSRFVVSGIIVGLKENKALLVDPSGKGYVVKEGMLIGNSDGHITRITASSIEVVERYREDSGHMRTRKTVLTLAKKSKEIAR